MHPPRTFPLSPRDSGPHHGHYITIIKAQGSWVVFDDDSVEAIKESEIPKYYGEGSSGAYVLFYQAVDMDREALGLPPDLPTSSAVDVLNETSPADGGTATILVDPASPPPDAVAGVPLSKDGEEAASSLSSSSLLPRKAKGPAAPLILDLPPPALNTSPSHSPVLSESVSKANTPGLTKGAAGFFQSLRHSASSKASMAKEKEAREKEKDATPPVPPTPLLNGDLYTNGHAHTNGVKEKEGKEGGGNIFRRSLKVTKKREPISVLPGSGSPALPASPRLPSSIPPSPNDHRRPSGSQVPLTPALTTTADETNVEPPPLPLPTAGLPLPTRGSTIDDMNATASISSSWTSASAPGPLSPIAHPLFPFTSPAQDPELPDRVPSPVGSSGRTGMVGPGTGPTAGVGVVNGHSKSNSSEFSAVPDLLQSNNNSNNNSQGQLATTFPWASSASISVPGQPGGPRSSSLPTRTFKISLGGSEAKKQKAASKAIEETQAREREREKKALEEKTRKMREEREKRIRLEKEEREKDEEKEKEREKEKEKEQQQQQQQQNNKPQKRASRKMSLSGMTVVGRLGASFGWSKDKDKHLDKDKDKGTTSPIPTPIPQIVRRGSHHTPSNEAEQDLRPPVPGYFAIGASPRFNL